MDWVVQFFTQGVDFTQNSDKVFAKYMSAALLLSLLVIVQLIVLILGDRRIKVVAV